MRFGALERDLLYVGHRRDAHVGTAMCFSLAIFSANHIPTYEHIWPNPEFFAFAGWAGHGLSIGEYKENVIHRKSRN